MNNVQAVPLWLCAAVLLVWDPIPPLCDRLPAPHPMEQTPGTTHTHTINYAAGIHTIKKRSCCCMDVITKIASKPSWRAWHSGSLHPLQKKRKSDPPLQQHRVWRGKNKMDLLYAQTHYWLKLIIIIIFLKWSANNLQNAPFNLPHRFVLSFLLWTILNKIWYFFLHLNTHIGFAQVNI